METTVRSAWSLGVAETPNQQDLSHQALSTRSGCAIHQVVAALSTFQCCSLPRIHLVHPLGSIRLHSHEVLITKKIVRSKSEYLSEYVAFLLLQKELALPLQHVPAQQNVLECLQCSRQGCTSALAVVVYRNALQNIQVPD